MAVLETAGVSGAGAAPPPLHPGAWLAWLVGVTGATFLTSNPLYLSLGLVATGAVYLSVRTSRKGRLLEPFVALGVAFVALSVPFNVFTGSAGETVLARVPSLASPGWLGGVAFGGDVTAEALAVATSRALTIATLVVAAAAFNASIDHFRLVRLAPRSLAQVGFAVTVALIVVPQSVAHGRSVAEAQRLRGRRARGIRALPALLLPVLQGALERAVQRAESMDARGFGGSAGAAGVPAAAAAALGLGLATWGAFAHYYFGAGVVSALLMAGGGVIVAVALVRGAGRPGARLRADAWRARDVSIAAASALAVVLVLGMRAIGAGDVSFGAYPSISPPAFHPAGALAFVLPALPLFLHDAERAP